MACCYYGTTCDRITFPRQLISSAITSVHISTWTLLPRITWAVLRALYLSIQYSLVASDVLDVILDVLEWPCSLVNNHTDCDRDIKLLQTTERTSCLLCWWPRVLLVQYLYFVFHLVSWVFSSIRWLVEQRVSASFVHIYVNCAVSFCFR